MLLYVINTILTLLCTLLLGFAIRADWHNARPIWRPVLIFGAIEQAVLAYGCWEAAKSHVPLETRQFLFFAAVLGLSLAVLCALVGGYRSGELTRPGSLTPRPPVE